MKKLKIEKYTADFRVLFYWLFGLLCGRGLDRKLNEILLHCARNRLGIASNIKVMEYTISTDKSKLNVDAIHDYLCNKSYSAKGNALGFTKGFTRTITDTVVYAYLMNLFIFNELLF